MITGRPRTSKDWMQPRWIELRGTCTCVDRTLTFCFSYKEKVACLSLLEHSADKTVLEAIQAGDESGFAEAIEDYRRGLHLHCYRMLGSFDDAEDLVQETLLRAWRARATFQGRSLFRTWLYRIATNACLTALERAPRRVLPRDVAAAITAQTDASQARAEPPRAPEVPWLQPYPDSRLEPAAPREAQPEEAVVARESIELTFLAALQHLPPRQRAVLILRDVLEWSASETASLVETSVASVNSAHQRARATLRARLGPDTPESRVTSSEAEQRALQAFMHAWEHADPERMTALLREDACWAMPPAPLWFDGRAAILRLLELFPIDWHGRRFRMLSTGANRQPAAAAYLSPDGVAPYQFTGVHVLRVLDGQIAEITTFGPDLCRAFNLPPTL
jgi:RNA polymerase sigma-70 factor (ECF subfamily)